MDYEPDQHGNNGYRMMINKFNDELDMVPMDIFVLLKVCSGMSTTPYDYVVCRKHSDGYKHGVWVTTQNERLTDSHTGEVFGWKNISEIDPESV